jgi:uncharacterized protein YidB (DUF937 family)
VKSESAKYLGAPAYELLWQPKFKLAWSSIKPGATMANPLLGQILGGVFANALRGRARSGPFGADAGSPGGGLGDLLGGMLGRGNAPASTTRSGSPFGGRGALVAMLLPFAMQWVQRNGGLGAVLQRFQQKGYGDHANSWISTGANRALDSQAVDDVVGHDELLRLSQQLGVPQHEVAGGFAEILPEMVDQLTPDGHVSPEADEALEAGQSELQKELSQLTTTAGM